MKLIIVSGKGSKSRSNEIEVKSNATISDIKQIYSKLIKKSVHRISFKFGEDNNAIRLNDDTKTLESYKITDGSTILFKDLGPQIGYRTVFLLEYFGPLVFVLLYATRPSFIYGSDAASKPFNWVALAGIISWSIHFLKREFETLFIHKFSHPTMPLSNLYKNCSYYWIFGAVIGYPLSSPTYEPPTSLNQIYIGLLIFAISEIGNLLVHIQLSLMRPAEGSNQREIPKGPLFYLVACPNYTFEVLSWVGFSIFTQIPLAYAFTLVGFYQMAVWAKQKDRGYKKTYEKEYTKLRRKAIVPFIY
eukprot:gene21762-28162_t